MPETTGSNVGGNSGTGANAAEHQREQARQFLFDIANALNVRIDKQHAFMENIKYILKTIFMPTQASKEVLLV